MSENIAAAQRSEIKIRKLTPWINLVVCGGWCFSASINGSLGLWPRAIFILIFLLCCVLFISSIKRSFIEIKEGAIFDNGKFIVKIEDIESYEKKSTAILINGKNGFSSRLSVFDLTRGQRSELQSVLDNLLTKDASNESLHRTGN